MIEEDYVVTYEYYNKRTDKKHVYITIVKAHNRVEAIRLATDYDSPYVKTKVLKCEKWEDLIERSKNLKGAPLKAQPVDVIVEETDYDL